MKVVVCKRHGPPASLAVKDVPAPQPAQGEVLVAVHASALNYPDTLIIENRYQYKPPLPFSPGGEVAGVVKALGAGVSGLKVGDRVIGVPGWGGFAEEVVVSAARVFPVPAGVAMDAAASLTYTYGTSYYALKERAALQRGETVLVLGAGGGTGLAVVELATLMGARVIAAASSAPKLEACRAAGADELIDYSREDLRERVRELTGGKGVDVVYDPVGGALAEPALRGMAWKGRYLVIGFASGEIPSLPLNLALLKGCSIVGVFFGSYMDREPVSCRALIGELASWLAEGRIHPMITARHPLEEAVQALRELAERCAIGKLVLTTASGRGEPPSL